MLYTYFTGSAGTKVQLSFAIFHPVEIINVSTQKMGKPGELFDPDEYIISNFGSADNFIRFREEASRQSACWRN